MHDALEVLVNVTNSFVFPVTAGEEFKFLIGDAGY